MASHFVVRDGFSSGCFARCAFDTMEAGFRMGADELLCVKSNNLVPRTIPSSRNWNT
jgi:hypothetical protein